MVLSSYFCWKMDQKNLEFFIDIEFSSSFILILESFLFFCFFLSRNSCLVLPHSLPKLLNSVKWNDRGDVAEVRKINFLIFFFFFFFFFLNL